MKASAGILIALSAALSAGSAFAQSATLNQSGGTIAAERTAHDRLIATTNSITVTAQVEESQPVGPVNGVGGQGGGRFTFTPVAGSRVALRGSSGSSPLQIGTTNGEGRVSTTLRAEPGAYEVTVACPARAPCRLGSVSIDGRSLTVDANGRFFLTVQAGVRR